MLPLAANGAALAFLGCLAVILLVALVMVLRMVSARARERAGERPTPPAARDDVVTPLRERKDGTLGSVEDEGADVRMT